MNPCLERALQHCSTALEPVLECHGNACVRLYSLKGASDTCEGFSDGNPFLSKNEEISLVWEGAASIKSTPRRLARGNGRA